jgi:hypothetical protein
LGIERCADRAAGQANREHVHERQRRVALATARSRAGVSGRSYRLPFVRKQHQGPGTCTMIDARLL